MNKKIKVTIGIPTYNEEKNIGNLLKSIISQKGNFKLESIFVVCDGCTDTTAQIATKLSKEDKRIKLINDGKRLGKTSRINQIFSESKSEILIMLDADILPENNSVIDEILKQFKRKNVTLVGGLDLPIKGKGLVSKSIVAGINLWIEVRKTFKEKDCIHNIHGCIYALHKNFYKSVSIPKEIINDDMYLYLKSRELGYKASFANRAVVYYLAPENLGDFYKQTYRFLVARKQIDEYFDFEFQKYFYISSKAKKLGIMNSFKKDPIFTLFAILLQISARWAIKFMTPQYNKQGVWNQISSTKKAIKI